MTLLQIFFIISGSIISLTAYDIAKRERFNALHFLVFLGVGWGLLFFAFVPNAVSRIGNIFGANGADVLVYTSITFLFYFVILLLQKTEYNRESLTRIIREAAIQNAQHAKK